MWERMLPPLQRAAIAAAKANDAVLALTGSLYAYGNSLTNGWMSAPR